MRNAQRSERRTRGDATVQSINETPGAITCDGCGKITSRVKYKDSTHKVGDMKAKAARQIDVCPSCFRKLEKRGLIKYPDPGRKKVRGRYEATKGRPIIPTDKLDTLKDRTSRITHGKLMSRHIRGFRVDKKGKEIRVPARRLFPDADKVEVFRHPENKDLSDYRILSSLEVYKRRKTGEAPAKVQNPEKLQETKAERGQKKGGFIGKLRDRLPGFQGSRVQGSGRSK